MEAFDLHKSKQKNLEKIARRFGKPNYGKKLHIEKWEGGSSNSLHGEIDATVAVQHNLLEDVDSLIIQVVPTAYQIVLSQIELLKKIHAEEEIEAKLPNKKQLVKIFFGIFAHELAFFYVFLDYIQKNRVLLIPRHLESINSTMSSKDKEVFDFIVRYFQKIEMNFTAENALFMLDIWRERKEFLSSVSPDQRNVRSHKSRVDEVEVREEVWLKRNKYKDDLKKVVRALQHSSFVQEIQAVGDLVLEEAILLNIISDEGKLMVWIREDVIYKLGEKIIVADYKFGQHVKDLSECDGYDLVQILLLMLGGAVYVREKMGKWQERVWKKETKAITVHFDEIQYLIRSVSLFFLVLNEDRFEERDMTLTDDLCEIALVNLRSLIVYFSTVEARNIFDHAKKITSSVDVAPVSALHPRRLTGEQFQPLLGEEEL